VIALASMWTVPRAPLSDPTFTKQCRIEDQIIQFFTGLNDQFYVVKTQVLLMGPLPSLNNGIFSGGSRHYYKMVKKWRPFNSAYNTKAL